MAFGQENETTQYSFSYVWLFILPNMQKEGEVSLQGHAVNNNTPPVILPACTQAVGTLPEEANGHQTTDWHPGLRDGAACRLFTWKSLRLSIMASLGIT